MSKTIKIVTYAAQEGIWFGGSGWIEYSWNEDKLFTSVVKRIDDEADDSSDCVEKQPCISPSIWQDLKEKKEISFDPYTGKTCDIKGEENQCDANTLTYFEQELDSKVQEFFIVVRAYPTQFAKVIHVGTHMQGAQEAIVQDLVNCCPLLLKKDISNIINEFPLRLERRKKIQSFSCDEIGDYGQPVLFCIQNVDKE